MNLRDTRKRILPLLLLMLFVGHLCNTTLFVHSHVIDGRIIVHSHFYTGNHENPSHSHASSQIQTIAQLSLLLLVLAAAIGLTALLTGKTVIRNATYRWPLKKTVSHPYTLRGPPVC